MACHASQLQLLLPHPSLGALEPGRVEEQLVVHRVLYQAGPHLCSLLQNEPGVHAASAPDSYTLERGQVQLLRRCELLLRLLSREPAASAPALRPRRT